MAGLKGKHLSREHRRKIAEANTGKHHTEETKNKLREIRKSQIITTEQKKKIGESVRRYFQEHRHPNKGKTYIEMYGKEKTDEINKKRGEQISKVQTGKSFPKWRCDLISKVLQGRESWNKGLTKETDERVVRHALATSKGVKQRWDTDPDYGQRVSKGAMLNWKNVDYQKKQKIARYIKPNKLEQEFGETFPQLNFVGNLAFFVGSKNPDFILPNTHKCIDLFGEPWHDKAEPEERIRYFAERGYVLLVIWQMADWVKNHKKTVKNVAIFLDLPLLLQVQRVSVGR